MKPLYSQASEMIHFKIYPCHLNQGRPMIAAITVNITLWRGCNHRKQHGVSHDHVIARTGAVLFAAGGGCVRAHAAAREAPGRALALCPLLLWADHDRLHPGLPPLHQANRLAQRLVCHWCAARLPSLAACAVPMRVSAAKRNRRRQGRLTVGVHVSIFCVVVGGWSDQRQLMCQGFNL